jgi:hypothetical protein
MRAFLKCMVVRTIVESEWKRPDKPMVEWTNDDKNACIGNDMAMNTIFMALSPDEFSQISQCEVANEAWDILEITHEETKTVKTYKIQMLISKFEEIRV